MIYMCMFFTLIILYLEVCVQTFKLFKREDGNGEGIEGGRDTGGSGVIGLGMLSYGKS